jgi:hypothetical protein
MRELFDRLMNRETAFTSQGFVANLAALQRLEADYFQTRLIRNAFWSFRFFCPYTQTLPDSLHMADLGVFQSILFAIFEDIEVKALQYLDNAEARRNLVGDRLAGRLRIEKLLDQEGVKQFVSNVAHRFASVKKNELKAPLFKAWEYRRLMLVSA